MPQDLLDIVAGLRIISSVDLDSKDSNYKQTQLWWAAAGKRHVEARMITICIWAIGVSYTHLLASPDHGAVRSSRHSVAEHAGQEV